MNKNMKILLSIAVSVIVIIPLALFLISKSSEDNSTITDDHYYVAKGLESFAKLAKPAVENYATQNTSESTEARKIRLSKYFTPNSPVYGYKQNNVDGVIVKSTAKLTSVVDFGGEDKSRIVSAIVRVKLESNKNDVIYIDQTYLITFYPDSNDNFTKANDIEEQIQ